MTDHINELRAIEAQKRTEWQDARATADNAIKAHIALQLAEMGIEIRKTIFTARRWSSDKNPQRWIAFSVDGSGRIQCHEVKKDGTRWMGRKSEYFVIDRILEVQS